MSLLQQGKYELMNSKGFSLLEVLIGLVILAIGLLAIAGMQITAIKGNDFSMNVTQAAVLAQDRLEILKNLPYNHATLVDGSYHEGPISGTIFSRQYDITDIGATMKKITVTVEWTGATNHRIRLETVRAR